jgi:hypothetical protein
MQQLDFFVSSRSSPPPTSSAPSSNWPIIGLKVRMPRSCRCGSCVATIGSSSGPHEHRLDCAQCGTWCRWLGTRETVFITKIATTFGCPTTPIVLREWRHV